jgi:hypothetical protein
MVGRADLIEFGLRVSPLLVNQFSTPQRTLPAPSSNMDILDGALVSSTTATELVTVIVSVGSNVQIPLQEKISEY